MSMGQDRGELPRGIRPGCMYRQNSVDIVKQPTYLDTTGHVRVGYAERAPPPPSDYKGPPNVLVV